MLGLFSQPITSFDTPSVARKPISPSEETPSMGIGSADTVYRSIVDEFPLPVSPSASQPEIIQREVADNEGADGAEDSDAGEDNQEQKKQDLRLLAQQIYPYLKRRLQIERQRMVK